MAAAHLVLILLLDVRNQLKLSRSIWVENAWGEREQDTRSLVQ